MSVQEALDIAAAAGDEPSGGFLAQLPPALAEATRAYMAQLAGGEREGAAAAEEEEEEEGAFEEEAAALEASLAELGASASASDLPARLRLQPGEGAWYYLDDSDGQQGPFGDRQMRERLWARYFGPATLVRFALLVSGIDASELDAEGVPLSFLPLATLFRDPSVAFAQEGARVWPPEYATASTYQSLVATAVECGVDRDVIAQQVLAMKEADNPPEISILLDMCGLRG